MEMLKTKTVSSDRNMRTRSLRALLGDEKYLSWRLDIRDDLGNMIGSLKTYLEFIITNLISIKIEGLFT